MGKLFRAIKGENIKLWSSKGLWLSAAMIFLLATVLSFAVAAAYGTDNGSAPGWLTEEIERPQVSLSDAQIEEYLRQQSLEKASAQLTSIHSQSDLSGTEIVALPDGETQNIDELTWQEKYRIQLEILKEENARLEAQAAMTSGAEQDRALAQQQKCVRSALVINKCLELDEEASTAVQWNALLLALRIMLAVMALCVSTVAVKSFTDEFRSGTVCTLFSMPLTRAKIYLAKKIVVDGYGLLLTVCSVLGCLTGSIMGFGGMENAGAFIRVIGAQAKAQSYPAHLFEIAVCTFFTLVLLVSVCVCLANLTHSAGAAVSVTLAVMVISMLTGRMIGGVGGVLTGMSLPVNLELSVPLSSLPNYPGASAVASWLSAAAHWLVFTVLGYVALRRDV